MDFRPPFNGSSVDGENNTGSVRRCQQFLLHSMVGCFKYRVELYNNNIPWALEERTNQLQQQAWNKTKLQGLPAEYYYMGRRRLENTMFFSGLPCMELCCGDGKQQNVFSNRITHFGGAAACVYRACTVVHFSTSLQKCIRNQRLYYNFIVLILAFFGLFLPFLMADSITQNFKKMIFMVIFKGPRGHFKDLCQTCSTVQ